MRDDPERDHRVAACLEVLGGASVAAVARRRSLDPAVLGRWVRAFVGAGTARVTNTPEEDAASERDRFLAAFAHELRTPLTVARGWVAMLEDDDLPPTMTANALQRLGEALGRLTDRVVDVELLAAASLGRVRLDPEQVRVGDLVSGLTDLDQVGGLGPDVELEVDPELFRLVLRDLWAAGSSVPAPRSLRLDVRRTGPWLELAVVRDADPIDIDVLRALFDPFELNSDGTGVTIGLYLARALVVAHAGTIGADQDETGATLWVRVPVPT